MKRGILVSNSSARANLLNRLGLDFSITPSFFSEESLSFLISNPFFPKLLSVAKMDYFLSHFSIGEEPFYLITADTMVFSRGALLGKPSSLEEAKSWIGSFQKKTLIVKTGFTFLYFEGQSLKERISGQEEVSLLFRNYTEEELDFYFSSNPPWQVAGGFAWQKGADLLIEKIEGHPSTIEGLPLPAFISFLKRNKILFND